jgi:nicotinamidase-related amidase
VKRALVVVDMINDFCDPDGKLFSKNIQAIIPNVRSAIWSARQEGIPIFYVADTHLPDDPEFKLFPPHGVSSWGSALVNSIDAQYSNVREMKNAQSAEQMIPKRKFSAFFNTDLDSLLREKGVEEVMLVGNCTDICVLFTAADARNRGYEVTIPAACVATFRPQSYHDAALLMMKNNLGCYITQRIVVDEPSQVASG